MEISFCNFSDVRIGREPLPKERKILCSPEELCYQYDEYERTLRTLHHSDQLNRAVVEEAHLTVLFDHFGESVRAMKRLRSDDITAQLVLMRDTIPPRIETDVMEAHGCDARNTKIFRGALDRANIYITVTHLDYGNQETLIDQCISQIVTQLYNPDDGRGKHIVTVLWRSLSQRLYRSVRDHPSLGGNVDIVQHHGGMSNVERGRAL